MLPSPFTERDFDVVAEHGDDYAITLNRERVLHNGVLPSWPDHPSPVLVSAVAKLGEYERVCTVSSGEKLLSSDHRWLGVFDDGLRLYDLQNSAEPGFVFFPSRTNEPFLSIHPSGEMVADYHDQKIRLHLPDEKVLSSAPYPKSKGEVVSICFSVDGNYLWVAKLPSDSNDHLHLLEVPTLKLLDRSDVPISPRSAYDGDNKGRAVWSEGDAFVDPVRNVLIANRYGGDSFLGVSFHAVKRGKIHTHDNMIGSGDSGFDSDPMGAILFHPEGNQFVGYARLGMIYKWDWPGITVRGDTATSEFSLTEWYETDGQQYEEMLAFCGELLLSGGELGNHVIDPTTMGWRGTIPESRADSFLPNGMLTKRVSRGTEIIRLKVKPKKIPVVAVVDNEEGQYKQIFRRLRSKWIDVTDDVCWIHTPWNIHNV